MPDALRDRIANDLNTLMRERPRKRVVFREARWWNTKTRREMHGIEARFVGERLWMKCCAGKDAMVFARKRDRDKVLGHCRSAEADRRKAALAAALESGA